MGWTRIESSMPRHPKVVGLSDPSFAAYVRVLCWCVEQSTDGYIPASVPFGTFAQKRPAAVLAELLAAGLLELNGTGVIVHDFDDYQLSGAEDKAKREAARLRKRRERERRHGDVTP